LEAFPTPLSALLPWNHASSTFQLPVQKRLSPLTGFGSNPGNLAALHFVAEDARDMLLVVVLHGCTQNASGFDRGTGWTQLADELRFAVLFPNKPERTIQPVLQLVSDNGQSPRCRRTDVDPPDGGRMVNRYEINRVRIYVTGLSAGRAMTSVMLAT
jgi:poly(3-hydroxybutyrate) depolymerase